MSPARKEPGPRGTLAPERPEELTDEILEEWLDEERRRHRRIGVPLVKKMFGWGTWRCEVCKEWVRQNTEEPPEKPKYEPPPEDPPEQKSEQRVSGSKQEIITVSSKIHTLEQALQFFDVDLDIWEVYKYDINKYEMGFTRGKGEDKEADSLGLTQVKAHLRLKAPKPQIDAILEIVEKRMPRVEPRSYGPLPKIDDPHMLVFSPVDHHFGKLAWAEETGTDYDLKIAEDLYVGAMEDALVKCAGYPIDLIEIPVGHDFFHFDSSRGTTASGTQMDVDSRPQKVFVTGFMAAVKAIDRAKIVAPVKVRYVRGNHDPTWSHHLAVALWAWYRNDERVEVDYSPMGRKYVEYGTNLLLLTHGDMAQSRLKQLPAQLAVAEPERWGRTRCWEILIGHWHHMKEMQFIPMEEHGGVMLRWLPSLCGTDEWHFTGGFVGNRRAALSLLYSKSRGYVGQFISPADEIFDRLEQAQV